MKSYTFEKCRVQRHISIFKKASKFQRLLSLYSWFLPIPLLLTTPQKYKIYT
jgi:hypothetical protein